MSTPTDTTRRSDAAVALTGGLVALLVLVSAMPPLGTAAYLAGLPMAAEDLGITTGAAQLTLTVYIIGLALGQIVIGPLSDRFGRRRPLLVGILAFVLFSISISFAPTLEIMLVLRLFQGIAASSGMVLGRAIVHDMVHGDRAARALNVITAAGLIVPALAPLLGSLILAFGTWRTIFLVLAGLGAVVGVWSFIRIPETHGVRAQSGPGGPGKRPAATPNMLRFVMYTAVVTGLVVLFLGAVLVLATVLLELHVAWYIAALAVAVAPVALISGSATALAMDSSPLRGGASSAVIGFSQSVLGAMAPPLVGILGVDARPMAMVFVGAALLGLIAAWVARPRAVAV